MSSAVSGVHWLVIEPSMGDQLGESEQGVESTVPPREPGCLQRNTPPTNKGTKGSPILRLGQC